MMYELHDFPISEGESSIQLPIGSIVLGGSGVVDQTFHAVVSVLVSEAAIYSEHKFILAEISAGSAIELDSFKWLGRCVSTISREYGTYDREGEFYTVPATFHLFEVLPQ